MTNPGYKLVFILELESEFSVPLRCPKDNCQVQAHSSKLTSFSVRIHSDEGLTLETSVFESFTVANLPYRPCG